MRTLIIGDIHGAYRALKQALERASLKIGDKLIFLGDYVDGWSESAEVIEYLMELDQQYECVFIRGNHDTWCEDWLRRAHADSTWVLHGGKSTMDSYGDFDEKKWTRHLNFFEAMKDYHVDENNNLFIHAGFSSMHGPAQEVYTTNYSWDRTLWEMALVMNKRIQKDSRSYPKRLKLFNEIFIGHTPTLHVDVDVPMNAINVWNVDTGAAFTGKLSVLDLETKEFWQSDECWKLYPGETGRNKK